LSDSSSDIRLKKDFSECKIDALSVIDQIKICEFTWRKDEHRQKIGMVADELEKLDPDFVTGGGYFDDGTMKIKAVKDFYLSGYLVKAIQELHEHIRKLENEIDELKKSDGR
jgi:adenylosuccinate synthase